MVLVTLRRNAPEVAHLGGCTNCGRADPAGAGDHVLVGQPGAATREYGLCRACGDVLVQVVHACGPQVTVVVQQEDRDGTNKVALAGVQREERGRQGARAAVDEARQHLDQEARALAQAEQALRQEAARLAQVEQHLAPRPRTGRRAGGDPGASRSSRPLRVGANEVPVEADTSSASPTNTPASTTPEPAIRDAQSLIGHQVVLDNRSFTWWTRTEEGKRAVAGVLVDTLREQDRLDKTGEDVTAATESYRVRP